MFSLGDLRRYSDTLPAKIIIFALAASFFIGFGVISFGGGQSGFVEGAVVANVEGESITNRDLAVAHQRLYSNYRERLGDQLTEDVLKQLNLRFQALNMLIEREVLISEAKRLGFAVSDEELKQYLLDIPAFQNEAGQFDKNRYKMILANQSPRTTPGEFEKQTRQQLLVDKLENYVKSTIHLREDEILREFLLDTREVSLKFLRFDADDLAGRIRIDQNDLQTYYETNIDDYITGEQADIRLLSFSLLPYIGNVDIGEDEIRSQYEADQAKYTKQEEVRASHILVKLPSNPTQEQEDEVVEQVKALKQRAIDGEPFADLAEQYSDDTGSAQRGGDLGWFGRGQMVTPFEDAAFAPDVEIGDIVGPVKTRFGYHILHIRDHQEAGTVPLSDVYNEIKATLRNRKASALAAQDANAVISALSSGQTIDEAAAALDPAPQDQTMRIGSNERSRSNVPGAVFDAVFGSQGNNEGGPILLETETGPVVVIVNGRAPSEPIPLADVADEIEVAVAEDKATTLAAERSAAALERLKRGEAIDRVARTYGVKVETTGPFTLRDEEIPAIGKNREIKNAAFSLSEANPTPRTTYKVGSEYFVLKLDSIQEPTPEDYQAERDVRKIELLEERRTDAWRSFIRSIKTRSEINLENPPADLLPQG